MSSGNPCTCEGSRKEKMKNWRILDYKCNHSAFNGYHMTSSDYSAVRCIVESCTGSWRTKAEYVDSLPIFKHGEEPK